MKEQKYIIGGGIAGLLAAYYFKDYTLIAKKDDVGGQFSSKFQLGPRFIKFNLNLKHLLDELMMVYTTKTIKVGYLVDDTVFGTISRKELLQYNKKLGRTKDLKGSLNNGDNKMEILHFSMKDFIKRLEIILQDEKRILYGEVVEINLDDESFMLKQLDNPNGKLISRSYENLISTIHYKDFCKLAKIVANVKCGDIYFSLFRESFFDFVKNFKDYDFVYDIDDKYITRLTKIPEGVVVESIKDLGVDNIIKDKYILKDAKLLDDYELKKIKNVIFLGRYAELNQEIRVDNLIDKLEKMK